MWNTGFAIPGTRLAGTASLCALLCLGLVSPVTAQQSPSGRIEGRVTSAQGAPVTGAQVYIEALNRGALTRGDGSYSLAQVPPGAHEVSVQMLGYRTTTARVTVAAGETATHDFELAPDVLNLQALVVTGTQTPRTNLDASVAVTTMTPVEIEMAAPRSTTEMLRYVPGFTRVESSGGEVNQNISMRGILGVEYVMFMEDGLPVFPTMHTFFMNADNLFRPDENIERLEVVRGGTSALFGSNTPGAIVNFINKTGGAELDGAMKATAGTEGLGRFDFNTNGPLNDDWRFNVGGFYRYDAGVRDPGFPGVRGGQLKGSVTRLLDNGYLRASFKAIDDRNQFILPLPFTNPDDPQYVSGFSDYGAMNTREGLNLRVPIPTGELELPLEDGIRTSARWLTANAFFELGEGWSLQNAAQVMSNDQSWNAILPGQPVAANDWAQGQVDRLIEEGVVSAGADYELRFTNHRDAAGNLQRFNTGNGLLSPAGQWHVEKPLSAFQNQVQLHKTLGQHNLSAGVYFGHYTQDNVWYFTDILMDVRDNPRFVDLVVHDGDRSVDVTKNGFRNFLSNYVSGSGQATVLSAMIGGGFQLTDRLRADAGVRYEWNEFVQSTENTASRDLDGDPSTVYDVEPWGTGSFRHFRHDMADWAGSLGLNYKVSEQLSVYGSGSRAFKMPALDEFLFAQAEEQIDLFDARETRSVEAGAKYATARYGGTVNGFYTVLKNIVSQGAVTDPNTGRTVWIVQTAPENVAYGAEVELSAEVAPGLHLLGSGTFLKAELGSGAGADIGSWINGVPEVIGNLSLRYTTPMGADVVGDWHLVSSRFVDEGKGVELPSYNYTNLGLVYPIPGRNLTLSANVLNASQSKGLEEGDPRAVLTGVGQSVFLARPLLPRRYTVSLRYEF